MRKHAFAVTAVIAVGIASPLSAQTHASHQGLNFSVGLGAGVADIEECAGCGSEGSNTSFAGFIRLGGTISPRWLGAVEAGGMYLSGDGYKAGHVTFSALGTFYPLSNGLKFNGGIGGVLFREDSPPNDNTANGIVWRVGAGYDIPLKETWSIAPFVEFVYGPSLSQKRNRLSTFAVMKMALVQFGVSLVIH